MRILDQGYVIIADAEGIDRVEIRPSQSGEPTSRVTVRFQPAPLLRSSCELTWTADELDCAIAVLEKARSLAVHMNSQRQDGRTPS